MGVKALVGHNMDILLLDGLTDTLQHLMPLYIMIFLFCYIYS